MRRAKIVCTLGPATEGKLDELVAAGMDCARLNFSHGSHESHAACAKAVRDASSRARRPLAIIADLCGPKMRIRKFAQGRVHLETGELMTLTTRDVVGGTHIVSVNHRSLPGDVRMGGHILLDDGLIRLVVERIEADDVVCRVEIGGELSDNKGLNLPGARVTAPAMTDKDRDDLRFAVEQVGVDYIALSFVRQPEDVLEAKALAGDVPVVAKIEKPEALDNLAEIIDVSDGVMVARGDLGVELGAEKVPLVQKRIIREVNDRGKLVITATQMLDSMIRNPRPTRAEAADVANAVLDGSDALMLSGETAAGAYPIESVKMMAAIIAEVEAGSRSEKLGVAREPSAIDGADWDFANAAARAAALLTRALPLKAVVTFTSDGRSASLLSEYRPRAPIVAITSQAKVANRLALDWGVAPRIEVPPDELEEALRIAKALLAREHFCETGDLFAMVVGWPPSGRTNTVKLHKL